MAESITQSVATVLASLLQHGNFTAQEVVDLAEQLHRRLASLEEELAAKHGLPPAWLDAAAVQMSGTAPQPLPALSETEPAQSTPALAGRVGSRTAGFDPDVWLASLPEKTPFAVAEASVNNSYNDYGWVGVYHDAVICLLDGKPTRLLTRRLQNKYGDRPEVSTPDAYRAHFRLPHDYPMGAPDFSVLKGKAIRAAHERRKDSDKSRPAELQSKIDSAIRTSGMDPELQLNSVSRPGEFADAIVCLECGAVVKNIAAHAQETHDLAWAQYISRNKLSSRYPRAVVAISLAEARSIAERHLIAEDRNPAQQIDAERWPGVMRRFIVCLEDGAEVEDLTRYLARKYKHMSFEDYRLKYSLPDNYPSIAAAGLVQDAV